MFTFYDIVCFSSLGPTQGKSCVEREEKQLLATLFKNWDGGMFLTYLLTAGGISIMTIALFCLSKRSVYDEWTGKVLYSYYPKANKAALVASLIFVIIVLYVGISWLS